jgi:uncharacterized protein
MTLTTSKTPIIKIHEIPIGGLDFKFSDQSGELNQVLFDLMGDYPTYTVEAQVRPLDKAVILTGKLTGELRHVCSRCAEEFSSKFSKTLQTTYCPSKETVPNFSGLINDMSGSFDLEFIEGNEINLAEVIHEHVALEIPFKPMCSEKCLGLCPRCGTNLNQNSCECVKNDHMELKASPFTVLGRLKGE